VNRCEINCVNAADIDSKIWLIDGHAR
jgi:hypothetical protein